MAVFLRFKQYMSTSQAVSRHSPAGATWAEGINTASSGERSYCCLATIYYHKQYHPHPIVVEKGEEIIRIAKTALIVCQTHTNVNGKALCLCAVNLQNAMFFYCKLCKNLYQYYKSCENPSDTASELSGEWYIYCLLLSNPTLHYHILALNGIHVQSLGKTSSVSVFVSFDVPKLPNMVSITMATACHPSVHMNSTQLATLSKAERGSHISR